MTNEHDTNRPHPLATAAVCILAVAVSAMLLLTALNGILPLCGAVLIGFPPVVAVPVLTALTTVGFLMVVCAGAVLVGAWEYARPLYYDTDQ